MTETVVTIDPNRNPQSGQPKTTPGGTTQIGGGLQFNIGYFTTAPGIIKLVQLILGVICMACAAPAYIAATDYFLFVVVSAFIATILWSFAYLLGIRELLTLPINWILTELLNTGIITVLYFIGFIVQLAKWAILDNTRPYGANIAAGVFGIFNTIAYAAGTYLLFIEHKRGSTQ